MKRFGIVSFIWLFGYLAGAQDSSKVLNPVIHYETQFNGTFDRNIVKRLLLISTNKIKIESKKNLNEILMNYRFGHITPNGGVRASLENDLFLQSENYFQKQRTVHPTAIMAFENSPNFRELISRWVLGAGLRALLVNRLNHYFHLNLYGLYETSVFKSLDYRVFRLFPSLKGISYFGNRSYGITYTASFGWAFADAQNYRTRLAIKPFVKISKSLDVNLMYDLWFENIINGKSPKEISTISLGLSYTNH